MIRSDNHWDPYRAVDYGDLAPNRGQLSLVSGATAEPVGLDEMKAHLRVDVTDDDGVIASMMLAARDMIEAWISRALITQTWDWYLPAFPSCDAYGGTFLVPLPPLQSVSSVKYIDSDGVEQTVSSSDYTVIAPAGPRAGFGTIRPAYGLFWPITYRYQPDAVRIRFVAGWTGPEQVPDPIRSALKLVVGDLYENREAQIADARAVIIANPTVQALLLNHQAFISGLRSA